MGGGYEQEGFYAGKIYYRRYHWQEVKELIEVAFEVEDIRGMRIVPREVLKRGGKMGLLLEGMLQHLAVSRSLGYSVLASGRKRAQVGSDRTQQAARVRPSG